MKVFLKFSLLVFLISISVNLMGQSVTITADGKTFNSGDAADITIYSTNTPILRGIRTSTGPALTNNQSLLRIAGWGILGSPVYSGEQVKLLFSADEDWSPSSMGTKMTFETTENGSAFPTEKMRIDNRGFVGVGTSGNSIEEKLHIRGGGMMINNTNPYLFFKTTGATNTGAAGLNFRNALNQTRAQFIYNYSNKLLKLSAGGTSGDIYIDGTIGTDNKVGLGESSPNAKLHVNYNSQGNNPQVLIEETGGSDFGRLSFENTGSSELWTIAGRASNNVANSALAIFSSQGGNVAIFRGNGNTSLNGFTQLGSSAPEVKMKKTHRYYR